MVNKYTLSVVTILTSISLYSCQAHVQSSDDGNGHHDFEIQIKDEHFSFDFKNRITIPNTPITSIKDLGEIKWTQTVQAEANYKFLQGSVFFERTGYVVKDVITGLAAVAKIALADTGYGALIPCKDTGLYTFNAKVAVPVNGNTYVGQVSSSPNKQAIGYVSSANQFSFSVEKTDKNGNVTKLADFDLLQPTTTDKLGVFDVY